MDTKFLFGLEYLHTLQNATTVAFDCETTGLQPKFGGLRLLQLAALDRLPVVIDCWALEDHHWVELEEFFAIKRYWVAHNAVFDLGWLQEHELYPEGEVLCTMLASRILTNGMPNVKHGLQHVVKRYLTEEISKEEQKSDWSGDLTASQLCYAAKDVQLLVDLDGPINQRMAKANLHHAWFLECKALPAMAQLWRTGLPFDRKSLQALQGDLTVEHEERGREFLVALDEALPADSKLPRDADGSINTRSKATGSVRAGTKLEAGFNLNSPKQLLDVFTKLLGRKPVDANGKASASRQALREYAGDHPVVAEYLAWKRVEKRRQMVEALIKHLGADGFIRASYMQLGADTGRMSCISPNLQQIPRDSRFRACVRPPKGWRLVVADYAQMELRLAAAEAEDALMIQAFQQGMDLHTLTAMQIYGVDEHEVTKEQRQVAKSANFGLLYGSGARGLRNYAAGMGIQMDLAEAAEVREKFHAAYAGISRWQRKNALAADACKGNAAIRIRKSQLRRFLPGEHNKLTTRCNTPIQGAGAAVLKRTLGKLWPMLKKESEEVVRLAGVVHDEVILLVREESADKWALQLAKTMEEAEAEWLGAVPALAEAHVGDSWLEAK
jgi:DNA polymerase I-like protein with 3'-5' exonuclease and polymerase domains